MQIAPHFSRCLQYGGCFFADRGCFRAFSDKKRICLQRNGRHIADRNEKGIIRVVPIKRMQDPPGKTVAARGLVNGRGPPRSGGRDERSEVFRASMNLFVGIVVVEDNNF